MAINYVKLYGMIGSIIFLFMLVISTPLAVLSLYKVVNPEYGIESWVYTNYSSFDTWKDNYKRDVDEDKKPTDQELATQHAEFKKTTLATSKRVNSEAAITAGVFMIISCLLLPVHYRIMNKKTVD